MHRLPPKLIITEDGSHTLYLESINETYHSFHGAWQESNHVFIEAGLEYVLKNCRPERINVLEVGFGTGLNAILTVLKVFGKNITVHYEGLEPYPLDMELIKSLNYINFLKNDRDVGLFESLHTCPWEKSVAITENFFLFKQKATLQCYRTPSRFELIYFDAFAPAKQPELWTREIIEKVNGLLAKDGILVTYSAKGQFKRDLAASGLTVQTLPGPPGKKEMVRAVKGIE